MMGKRAILYATVITIRFCHQSDFKVTERMHQMKGCHGNFMVNDVEGFDR